MHVAVIGTGRVGRPTAYSILSSGLASEMTVCDIKPGLARAFREELKHVTASLRLDVEVHYTEHSRDVSGADIIVICAGFPRQPGVRMSRRELIGKNTEIVKSIAEAARKGNPGAKYVVVTNPVDAMAMVAKKYSGAEFVISTGTHLESLRLRARLSEVLKVPVSKIQGWVGGEHGEAAVPLWSTVRILGRRLEEVSGDPETLKSEVEQYMKVIPEVIIDSIGGTEYGPASAFRDILRAIVKNTDEILAVASPFRFEGLPEPVWVSVPIRVGMELGPSLYDSLAEEEKLKLVEAAKVIYSVYLGALSALGESPAGA